jgi:curli biogenesis system outer membrane secretion channel CsgG
MKSRLLFIIFSFLYSMSVHADIKEDIVRVTGHGETSELAIKSALIEGVKQRTGVKIDAVRSYKEDTEEGIERENSEVKKISSESSSFRSLIKESASGMVQEYEIVSMKRSKGRWIVTLDITFKKYVTPGISPHNRRKIAIMPFRTLMHSYKVNGDRYTSSAFSNSFTQHLTNHLTQSRKFSVLDREYMSEYLSEKDLIISESKSIEEQVKIGGILGADYIVVGKIGQASIGRKNNALDIIGESASSYSAEIDIDYRIIVLATRQVKWSDTISLSIDQEDIDRITRNKQDNAASQAILSHFASIISNQLTSNIYPLRVVSKSIDRVTVVLNQGGKSLAEGDKLKIMSLGENVVDPYTGESLGQQEHTIATIEIIKVMPKMSIAKVVSGDILSINNLDVARRIDKSVNRKDASNRSWRKTNTKVLDSGGVVLPFD